MRARHSERIRFGILSARERLAPERLTLRQRLFLYSHEDWMVGDAGTIDAYDHEAVKLQGQMRDGSHP